MGLKKAKEIWFLCRQYDAAHALDMGLVNAVVPVADLERETVRWCREMLALSPFALRLLKASFHAAEDGYAGIQQLAHDANLLFYGTDEAQEGREAFKAKRPPGVQRVPPPRLTAVWARAGFLSLPGQVSAGVLFGGPGLTLLLHTRYDALTGAYQALRVIWVTSSTAEGTGS